MRSANVLDVLKAVTTVAPSYPDIDVWWYAPLADFHSSAGQEARPRPYEVVVAGNSGPPDLDGLEKDLSAHLYGQPVRVRVHRGAEEERQLFRMLSAR